jgi:hypothetical protein
VTLVVKIGDGPAWRPDPPVTAVANIVKQPHHLEYQQNLRAVTLSIVVLVAASNALEDLLPLVPEALDVLSVIQPGQVVRVLGTGDAGDD